jgi:hypothetical protein
VLGRLLSLGLLLAAGIPIAYGLRMLSVDPPRAGAIMATAGLAALLSLLIVVGRPPRPSAWLKLMGLGMCVIVLAAVGGMGIYFERVKAAEAQASLKRLRNMPSEERADLESQAAAYRTRGTRLYVLAATLAGCGVAVALLPARRPQSRPSSAGSAAASTKRAATGGRAASVGSVPDRSSDRPVE